MFSKINISGLEIGPRAREAYALPQLWPGGSRLGKERCFRAREGVRESFLSRDIKSNENLREKILHLGDPIYRLSDLFQDGYPTEKHGDLG